MIFDTCVPEQPLGAFIERFICYSDYKVGHAIDRFLPDGNTEIIIDLTDTPQPIFDNVTLQEIQSCKECWASGVRTQPISIPSGNGSAMFIIIFKKGMAAPFFPLPIEMFKRAVGVTPKTYLLIHRFQKAVQEIERRPNLDCAQLALDCGYFDQSHFVHSFKRFSGFTPTEYVSRKNGILNYVPVG
ncbi:MAG TPA: hypothetical protein DEP53_19370 [Bacteroidetes bacterium]|nr:hypothetical protein [Bacteroidota bacterium]